MALFLNEREVADLLPMGEWQPPTQGTTSSDTKPIHPSEAPAAPR